MTMRARGAMALAVLLLLLLPNRVEGRETGEPRFEAARVKIFQQALDAERERQGIVGVAVAVIEQGKLAHVATSGLAHRNTQSPITERTLFRWASVAKPLTAIAALQLVEAKTMALDAPARTYWKTLPADGLGKVPLEALLRHQGGVGHYAQMGDWKARLEKHYGDRAKVPWDAAKSVAVVRGPPLLHAPYARYHYTTFGYNLLGALVESAGKEPFEDQVAKRIAKPLGLKSLEPDYEFRRRAHRTSGYRKKGGKVVASEPGDVSWKLPGGGFHSTVGDMGRFGVALLNGSLLGKDMHAAMLGVRQPAEGTTSYGMGVGVRRKDGVVTRISHSGAQARTRTLLVLDPPNKRGFAIMTNSEWAKTSEIWRAARKALGW